jgi:hypothetical protein
MFIYVNVITGLHPMTVVFSMQIWNILSVINVCVNDTSSYIMTVALRCLYVNVTSYYDCCFQSKYEKPWVVVSMFM